MDYLWFSLWFTVLHLGSYMVAGMVTLQFTKDLYQGDDALFSPFMRDVAQPAERQWQGIVLWPAQLLRGALMSVVLYPVLTPLSELGAVTRFGFLFGLMFVYADLAAATPFPNNIEGLVYLKRRFLRPDVFWRIQSETLIYSLLFASLAGWLAF